MRLRLGISTCPNDTFAFHALMHQKVDLRGLEFDVELMDVQELNERLAAGTLDVSKASFHAALHLSGRYGVLRAGSALGVGVGPLLLSAPASAGRQPAVDSIVLCPGAWTTATLLFRCLYPHAANVQHRLFSDIMPALRRGGADFGVVIHEGRFTYRREGLNLVADLGEMWERRTGGPVPLGGILARLDLGADVHARLNRVIHESTRYGFDHREETFGTMRQHAQELEPDVIWSHVELYVNKHTLDLGQAGRDALEAMERLARAAHLISANAPPLRLLGEAPAAAAPQRG